ncbi:MAG: hypothetical protein FJ245_05300 [Nitrospira sp.]|nr:hypothetical protein [Nitrospira sp.]
MRDSLHKMPQLLRHFLAISLGNYGALAASFLISIVVTRRLGVEQFGRLSLFLMVSQVLMLVVANWTQVGLIRDGSQEFSTDGSIARTFWARLSIVAPLLTVSAAVFFSARGPLAVYLEIPEGALALVYGHFLLAFVLASLSAVLQARQQMATYGAVMFSEKAVSLLLVTVLPASVLNNPLAVVGCYATSACLISAGTVGVLGWRTFLPIRIDSAASHALLRFSLPFTLTSWAGLFGTSWLDFVVLKWSRSVADVGLYALASQLAGVIQQVTITFSTLLLPHFSALVGSGDEARIKVFVDKWLPYWFLGTSATFGLALVVAGPAVPTVFGQHFAESVPPLAILMVATTALALYNAFDPLLSAYGATWALVKITLGSVVIKLALAPVLIPPLGVAGAAISTVASYWFSAFCVLALAQSRLKVPVVQLAWLGLPVGVACAGLLLFEGRDFYAVATAGVFVSVALLAVRFRLFQKEDRMLLQELRGRAVARNGAHPAGSRSRAVRLEDVEGRG